MSPPDQYQATCISSIVGLIYPAAFQSIINGLFPCHNTFFLSKSVWLITKLHLAYSSASYVHFSMPLSIKLSLSYFILFIIIT